MKKAEILERTKKFTNEELIYIAKEINEQENFAEDSDVRVMISEILNLKLEDVTAIHFTTVAPYLCYGLAYRLLNI